MWKKWSIFRVSTVKIIALGFMGVILAGAFLLWLPISNSASLPFIDTLFTSTSAVCVTGLMTIVPATSLTPFGKLVLLFLIQVGGFGIIALMTTFFLVTGKQITVKQRVVIRQAYGLETLAGMVSFIRRILYGTIVVEGAGALLYSVVFIPRYGIVHGVFYSVFHSVSAFCNAGIDLLGDKSLMGYVENPLINVTTMLLIVLGGLGFPVWYDLCATIREHGGRGSCKRRMWGRLTLQSKIVLTMTGLLIVIGTVCFFVLESRNPETMGQLTIPEQIMASAFQSVTTRTAGFATVPQDMLSKGSRFAGIVLMFIGGSPAGTAGGVKTTTVAMLLLTAHSVLRGKRDTECFGRKVSDDIVRTGITITLLSFFSWGVGTMLVTVVDSQADTLNVMYETMSALGTVGLSAGLTSSLSRVSQLILIALMYLGRIGPMTMALVFVGKTDESSAQRELPEKPIMIG